MYIYSGNYRLCRTGIETDLKDDKGEILYTGDIVLPYTIDKSSQITGLYDLSSVVANHYSNTIGGVTEELPREKWEDPFIMGIRYCNISEAPGTTYNGIAWRVKKIKSFCYAVSQEFVPGANLHYYLG